MASFYPMRGSGRRVAKRWNEVHRDIVLETPDWEPIRYLDSGAFTLMRQAGVRPKAQSLDIAVGEITMDVDVFKSYVSDYVEYLREYKDDWDVIIEMDVDTLNFGEVSGIEVAQTCRRMLERVVGPRLMPVWHTIAGQGAWKDMVARFPYVAMGGVSYKSRETRMRVDYAHSQGVKVHGLGISKAEHLAQTTFDTVDSTTWLSSIKFGQYCGWRFSAKECKYNDARAVSRARQFRDIVRGLGYDPEILLEPGASQIEKFEVAIALFQMREAEAPPINSIITPVGGIHGNNVDS